jgi:hypothetical protein
MAADSSFLCHYSCNPIVSLRNTIPSFLHDMPLASAFTAKLLYEVRFSRWMVVFVADEKAA